MKCLLCSLFLSLALSRDLYVHGEFQSAGCSDEGCGIPCYLRPAEDECHYSLSPPDPCNAGGATDLERDLSFLNDSLVRLQIKLIQKGVSKCQESVMPCSKVMILVGGRSWVHS